MIIIRCYNCEGLLKLDRDRLPVGKGFKVRCPHCSTVGAMPPEPWEVAAPDRSGTSDTIYPTLLPVAGAPPRPVGGPATRPGPAGSRKGPPERGGDPQVGKVRSRGWRIAVWALASLAVVACFALLVNVVLPGPGGASRVIHGAPAPDGVPPGVR